MNKLIKSVFAVSFLPMMLVGCRVYTYEERGSRNIEPQHQVVTVPIVADVELLSAEKITYKETFTKADLENVENYKYMALAHAIKQYNADFLIGAMYDINYTNRRRTLEVVVTGFPVKYKELRKATPEDQWFFDNKVQ
jgi:hypothetical protein